MSSLDGAHRSFEESLLNLEMLAERLAAREPEGGDARSAGRILDCFDRLAVAHHREEERILFPALRARAAEAGRPELCAMLYEVEMEHARMESLFADTLRPALEAIARGAAARLRPEAVAHFAWLCRRHIRLEADALAPFATAHA